MKVAIFSFDTGPARNLSRVMNALVNAGHYITQATLGGSFKGNLLEPRPDVVLTAMSSAYYDDDWRLWNQIINLNLQSRTVFIGDTYTACHRPSFASEDLSQATAIVAGEHEIPIVKKFGFGQAVYLGGPPAWYDWHFLKPIDIKKIDTEKIIAVGGIKDGRLTNRILHHAVNALEKTGFKYQLIFRAHPREDPATIDHIERANILKPCKWTAMSEAVVEVIVATADLCIFPVGTTPMITCAYTHTPVVCFTDSELRARFLEQCGQTENDFYPVKVGATIRARADEMERIVKELLSKSDKQQALLEIQSRIWPNPQPNEKSPTERIVQFLEKTFA